MRKVIGGALLAMGMLSVPGAARAQVHRDAKHEFGVDLSIGYAKETNVAGVFGVATPVDVRIGFVSAGKLMFEPRFTFKLESDGGTTYALSPTLGVLYALRQGHKQGPYVRAAAGFDFADDGINSGVGFGVGAGIGTRIGYGSGAFRLEAVLAYDFKSTDLGRNNTFNIGALVGLSLWH